MSSVYRPFDSDSQPWCREEVPGEPPNIEITYCCISATSNSVVPLAKLLPAFDFFSYFLATGLNTSKMIKFTESKLS